MEETLEAGLEEVPPSIESDVREERIAARRLRIRAKIEAEKRVTLGEPIEEFDENTNLESERRSKKQLRESYQRLDKLISDGNQLVSNVRVAGDAREIQRRHEAAEFRKTRLDKIQMDDTTSEERFDEINKKWAPALSKSIPKDIQEKLAEQKAAYDEMKEEKASLVEELQLELKELDDQYVQDLKKQAEDVDLLLERMEEQVKSLAKGHKEELKEIEHAFEAERKDLIRQQLEEWEVAMETRRRFEVGNLEDKDTMIEDNEKAIREMRTKHAEELKQIKIKLETDIQNLQQQVQQMKATFQLNAEKLEYNLHVLKKRDDENTMTISQQKRKITRLQDTLTGLHRRLALQEKQLRESLHNITEEYRRSVEQFTELQKKFSHFIGCDKQRFVDIWQMKESETSELLREVLRSDQVIHSQQMGLPWIAPSIPPNPLIPHLKGEVPGTSKAVAYAASILSADETSLSSISLSKPPERPTAVIKQVLELLVRESHFLVESKFSKLLEPLEENEKVLMKLDAIFKALDINSETDIHQLVEFFILKETVNPWESTEGSVQEDLEKHSICEVGGVHLIHQNEVAKVLRNFVEERHGSSNKILTSSLLQLKTSSWTGDEKALLDGSYWESVAKVLPKSNRRVWSALQGALEQYSDTLTSRSSLITECDGLRKQNAELRFLLQQYMHSKINDELIIPPTQVMTMEQS